MSSIKAFFDNTFFMNGAEGIILFAICIAAVVLTLVAIAMTVVVAVSVKRHGRENAASPAPVQEAPTPAEAHEPPAELPQEAPAASGEPAAVFSVPFAGNGVRYNKSFTARLIQSTDEVKAWYARLKNDMLSYQRVKARMSWKRESFRFAKNIVARLGYRGGTLCVYLPLDPASLEGSKYKVEDVSEYSAYTDTPCMYRMKNERRVRYAMELIAELMDTWGAKRIERTEEDYYLPYEENEPLLERGLIKYEAAETAGGAPFPQAAEEIATAEAPVPSDDEPVEAPEEPAEEPVEESAEESVEEHSEPTVEETEIEELTTQEIDDVASYEEEEKDEDGIEVIGVMFRRRGRKVYWFDPDGKTWEKGEIALYKSPIHPPQEVIVVDNARLSPSKLHLPLKPLRKAPRRPQPPKKK